MGNGEVIGFNISDIFQEDVVGVVVVDLELVGWISIESSIISLHFHYDGFIFPLE